jgi:hypothetical protein
MAEAIPIPPDPDPREIPSAEPALEANGGVPNTAADPEIEAVTTPEDSKEAPMLDVHPPHDPIHSWKEYLLHMSTIVLGLLIAIGLEQSVEALHHRQQLHQLEKDERAEARRNVDILTTHFEVNIPTMYWYRAALAAARTAVPSNGFVDIVLPPPDPHESSKTMLSPERYVIPGAVSSGSIALLPGPVAQTYARLDYQAQEDQKEVDKIRDDRALIDRFALETGSEIRLGEHLHLTPARRDQLVTALSAYADGLYALLRRDSIYLNYCSAVADGLQDPDALKNYLSNHTVLVEKYQP